MADGPQKRGLPIKIVIVFLAVFIDAFGGLMAAPVLPFIVQEAGKQFTVKESTQPTVHAHLL